MPQLHERMVLNGRYRVQELLAMGGMAEVWVAQDLLLGRPVAVKVLRAGMAHDPEAAVRLRSEAKAAAMLSSARVVRVHDVGELVDDDGRSSPYLVMELVPGDTLREHLRQPMDPDTVARLITQIASALAEAHALGLVHRDIKPANILITPAGEAKVTDFGISSSSESEGLTATGLVMGTARYLAPERVSGHRATAASDVYSLGVVAHEALRGQPMFSAHGEVEAALAHVQQTPPPLPAATPAPLAALVTAMLAKDPLRRPTAAQVASGDLVKPLRTPTIPLVLTSRAPRAGSSNRPLAFACLALLLGIAGAVAATDGSPSRLPRGVVDSSAKVAPSQAPHATATPTSSTPTSSSAPVTTSTKIATVARVVPAAPHPPAAGPAGKGHGKAKGHAKHGGDDQND